ncbi:MAG: site-specific DNA-methyltransferase, partial [Zoogloeaceae bacterium]|nr:site-specific DNA-methyltransferase [Zoogloeaceae bacterium]
MPTFDWLGKDKIIDHHKDVPFRVLERKYAFGAESENILIKGDNLHALKALLPQYEGRVKCVYIDPPYNTGNEGWVYNDNVNDPKLKKWLGEVVGKEGEDLSRHDKWLCMMYPRLRLLQKLLSDDGVIIISMSYHEIANLILLCKEIFATKQIVPVTVQTSGGKPSAGFNYVQEYLVFIVPIDFNPHPTSFSGGNKTAPFHGMNLATFTQSQRPNQTYPIYVKIETGEIVGCGNSLADRVNSGHYTGDLNDFEFNYSEAPEGCVAVWPVSNKGIPCVWRLIATRLMRDKSKGYIKVLKQNRKKNKNIFAIQYLSAGIIQKIENFEIEIIGRETANQTVMLSEYNSEGVSIPTIWLEKDFYTVNGNNQMLDIFNFKAFPYPKPEQLIQEVLQATTHPGDIILDSFAGSGTTAHAVLNLNRRDRNNTWGGGGGGGGGGVSGG